MKFPVWLRRWIARYPISAKIAAVLVILGTVALFWAAVVVAGAIP